MPVIWLSFCHSWPPTTPPFLPPSCPILVTLAWPSSFSLCHAQPGSDMGPRGSQLFSDEFPEDDGSLVLSPRRARSARRLDHHLSWRTESQCRVQVAGPSSCRSVPNPLLESGLPPSSQAPVGATQSVRRVLVTQTAEGRVRALFLIPGALLVCKTVATDK